jgi:hypothetical protein
MKGIAGLFLVAVILTIGYFWYFGRAQPLAVVEHEMQTNTTSTCDACMGSKSSRCMGCGENGEVKAGIVICPSCRGTGHGEWQMKPAGTIRRMPSDRGPLCPACRGIPRRETMQPCPQCAGTLKVRCPKCSGRGTVSTPRKVVFRTVQSRTSLWERFLWWFFVMPDSDCAPQVDSGGRVPMVESYLSLFHREGVSGRVIKWGGTTRGAKGWEVRTLLRVTRGNVTTDEGRVFFVKNREVSGAAPIEWP